MFDFTEALLLLIQLIFLISFFYNQILVFLIQKVNSSKEIQYPLKEKCYRQYNYTAVKGLGIAILSTLTEIKPTLSDCFYPQLLSTYFITLKRRSANRWKKK